jgi:anaerobic magnesium-protoporphyrin IX monomethyl ester cyclase
MTDCLIIGFNDMEFNTYVDMLKLMGTESGAFKDVDLAYVEYEGTPHRSMDLLNRLRDPGGWGGGRHLHNADFLWPVVVYLGTYLKRRGFTFDYVNLFHLEKDKLRERLSSGQVATVAITTTLYVAAEPITEIVSFIRQHAPHTRIIIGGPYIMNQASMMKEEDLQRLFDYLGCDFYVLSQEGEATLVSLLKALQGGTPLEEVPNLAFRQGERFVRTAKVTESNPLEENPVDYTLFPREEIGGFMSVRTAKSCPFSCAFCGFPQRAGKYKYLSVELVEAELERLAEAGVHTLTFLDDTFNVPKKRYRQILEMMIQRRFGFRWNAFYRCDHGDDEVIELMAAAGCEGVFLGAESGSDEMLARMNKAVRRKDFLRAIPKLQSVGISCHANFIVGFPGETLETVAETMDLIEQTRPDFFRAQLWYADPMTPIWEQRERYGLTGEAFKWAHATMDSETAADLVDRMFLSVQNSNWLPQHGFEQWSTFYLQRKGMSLAQIKTFVRSFNAAVKRKLINPHERQLGGPLLETLSRAARLELARPPDMRPVMEVEGERYRAAEAWWLRVAAELGTESVLHGFRDGPGGPRRGLARQRVELGLESVDRLAERLGVAPEDLLMTAYAVLLSRLTGNEHVSLVAALATETRRGAVPVPLSTHWSQSLAALTRHNRRTVDGALEHQLYAFTVLCNPHRLALRGLGRPALNIGFTYITNEGTSPQGLLNRPEVSAGLELHLVIERHGASARLEYEPSTLTASSASRLAVWLARLLERGAAAPELQTGELQLMPGSMPAEAAVADEAERFAF